MVNNELTHHGIKGMRWGRRRYQNEDGSLTPAGEKRYARDAKEQGYTTREEDGSFSRTTKKNGKETLSVDANRYAREDLNRSKRLADEASTMTTRLKTLNDQSMRNKPKVTMDLSNMTDKQMRDEINRAMLERQYTDMFAPKNVSNGQERVSRMLETSGTVLATVSSALAIALAVKDLKG